MAAKPINVKPWTPDARQCALIETYALGYSWHRSAVMKGIPARTYHNWFRDHPEIREMGEELREQSLQNLGDAHQSLVTRCYSILERVGAGSDELSPDNKLVAWAERILSKTTWPVLMARGLSGAGVELNGQQALRLVGAGESSQQT